MTCLETRRRLPRFVAMELGAAEEREVREHLGGCAGCRQVATAHEPALVLAGALAVAPGPEDDRFVGEVMAAIHQRRLERRLASRRSRLLAAAAAAVSVVLLGGVTVVRELTHHSRPLLAQGSAVVVRPAARPEPAFVEVDNAGARVYQLTAASSSRRAVQVAFIVDPHLEL